MKTRIQKKPGILLGPISRDLLLIVLPLLFAVVACFSVVILSSPLAFMVFGIFAVAGLITALNYNPHA